MSALDELRTSLNIEVLVEEIASQMQRDLPKIHPPYLNDYSPQIQLSSFECSGGLRNIIFLMARAHLVGLEVNSSGCGQYYYKPEAAVLYKKLMAEGYYEAAKKAV